MQLCLGCFILQWRFKMSFHTYYFYFEHIFNNMLYTCLKLLTFLWEFLRVKVSQEFSGISTVQFCYAADYFRDEFMCFLSFWSVNLSSSKHNYNRSFFHVTNRPHFKWFTLLQIESRKRLKMTFKINSQMVPFSSSEHTSITNQSGKHLHKNLGNLDNCCKIC